MSVQKIVFLTWMVITTAQECFARILTDVKTNDLEGQDEGDCTELIPGGDMERDVSGWRASFGARIRIRPEGANGSQQSLEVYRRNFRAGPTFNMEPGCLKPNQKYLFMAQVKILTEDDFGFPINKFTTFTRPNFLTAGIRASFAGGKKPVTFNFPNEDFSSWSMNGWNAYRSILTFNDLVSQATKIFLYFMGPKSGTKLIVDEVSLKEYNPVENCGQPLFQSTAETGYDYDLRIKGDVSIDQISPGGQNSTYAFLNSGRRSAWNGISFPVDVACWKMGADYDIFADFKLLGEDDEPIVCDRESRLLVGRDACPSFFLSFWIPEKKGLKKNSGVIRNSVKKTWSANDFNAYKGTHHVRHAMATSAVRAELRLVGPRAGTKIIFDNLKYQITCDHLFLNYDVEIGSTLHWGTGDGNGELERTNKRKDSGSWALLLSGRTSWRNGVGQLVETICVKEGKQYELVAQVMLLDEKNQPLLVDKWAKLGDDTYLILSIKLTFPSGRTKIIDYPNQDFSEWTQTKFNTFRTMFTFDAEFEAATQVFVYFRGPQRRVSIVLDNVTVKLYEKNCYDRLSVGDEKGGEVSLGWRVSEPSYLNKIPGVNENEFYYEHINRANGDVGVSHDIDPDCFFLDGMKFFFEGYFKITDENKAPISCSWDVRDIGDPRACPVVSFRVHLPSDVRWLYAWPQKEWVANEWNHYYFDFIVFDDMEKASNITMFISGPPPGVNILFDFADLLGIWPSSAPSLTPTTSPTAGPTREHSVSPSNLHSSVPTKFPIKSPSNSPTISPSVSNTPTYRPSHTPSEEPTVSPTSLPSMFPSKSPSATPTEIPTSISSMFPSKSPSATPTEIPTSISSMFPSKSPSATPTEIPTSLPSMFPSKSPSATPTEIPTFFLSQSPSALPSVMSSGRPTSPPTSLPTKTHSSLPTSFPSGVPTDIPSFIPTLRSCDPIILNGDHKDFQDSGGWESSFGGKLELIHDGFDGNLHAFKYSNRNSYNSGPEQKLPVRCLQEGVKYEISADINLQDEEDTPYYCSKEAVWRSDNFCVVLSIQIKSKSGTKVVNIANKDVSYWIESEFNSFCAAFTVTSDMVSAAELSFRLIGPRAGVSILFANVFLRSLGGTGAYKSFENDYSCDEIITNGDMQKGTLGWKTINGGSLEAIALEGNNLAVKNIHRVTSFSGITQEMNPLCIVPGKSLRFQASIKLFNEQGYPMGCDKEIHISGHSDRCPFVSLQATYPAKTETIELLNEDLSDWYPDDFNEYKAIFVGPNFEDADGLTLTISGVRPGASIIIDDIILEETFASLTERYSNQNNDEFFDVLRPHYSMDGIIVGELSSPTSLPTTSIITVEDEPKADYIGECSELIKNGDAENGDTAGWTAAFGGKIDIINHGAKGSGHGFEIFARLFESSGPKQFLNIDCFKVGEQFELTAFIKLKDRYGEPYKHDKHAVWGDESFLVASIYIEKSSGDDLIDLPNDDPSQWIESEYNMFRSVLSVTNIFEGASRIFLFFYGPKDEISIEFDEVSLSRFVPPKPNCEELILHGNAEAGSYMGWSVTSDGGYVNLHEKRSSIDDVFFENGGRTSPSSGPKYEINTNCLTSSVYEFTAQIKLLSEKLDPVVCDIHAIRNTELTCPVVSIEFLVGGVMKVFELKNAVSSQWVPNVFNRYYSTFSVTEDLLSAKTSAIFINGPAADVSILFDEVSFSELRKHDCSKVVTNGSAESMNITSWEVYQSGNLEIVDDNAFILTNRTSYTSGPKQRIDANCLVEGAEYRFTAKLKLEDENGDPFFCAEKAEWRSESHCVILSFVVVSDTSETNNIMNLANEETSLWREGEFNDFHVVFKVSKGLISGRDLFFVLRGPRAGVSILFKDVSIEQYDPF